MSPNVLIFTDEASGTPHGYVFDGWVDDDDDKVFLYTGEGQQGDQQLVRGNAAILHHRQDGRALRLFEGAGGHSVRYVGRFSKWTRRSPIPNDRLPGRLGGPTRTVLVFRLREMQDRGTDELFDTAWEQLRSHLTPDGQWESLVEQQRYRLDAFSSTPPLVTQG